MRVLISLTCLLAACATPRDLCVEGWQRIERCDYVGAATLFERDLAAHESSVAHVGRARALYLLGRLPEATAAYERARALDPRNAQVCVGQSLVELARGDFEGAIRSCDRALEIDGTLAKAWYNRGLAHERAASLEAALADLAHALELESGFAHAYFARGLVFVRLERLDEAIQDFRAAAQLDPLLSEAHANCAAAHYAKGEVDLALGELDAAIKIDRRQPLFYVNRGRIYLDHGDAARAAADFEQALAFGQDARLWDLLAEAHERSGLTDRAREEYAKARRLEPLREARPAGELRVGEN